LLWCAIGRPCHRAATPRLRLAPSPARRRTRVPESASSPRPSAGLASRQRKAAQALALEIQPLRAGLSGAPASRGRWAHSASIDTNKCASIDSESPQPLSGRLGREASKGGEAILDRGHRARRGHQALATEHPPPGHSRRSAGDGRPTLCRTKPGNAAAGPRQRSPQESVTTGICQNTLNFKHPRGNGPIKWLPRGDAAARSVPLARSSVPALPSFRCIRRGDSQSSAPPHRVHSLGKCRQKTGEERQQSLHRWRWAAAGTPVERPGLNHRLAIDHGECGASWSRGPVFVFPPPAKRSCPWGVVSFDLAAMVGRRREQVGTSEKSGGESPDRPADGSPIPGIEKGRLVGQTLGQNTEQGPCPRGGGWPRRFSRKARPFFWIAAAVGGKTATSTAVFAHRSRIARLLASLLMPNSGYQPFASGGRSPPHPLGIRRRTTPPAQWGTGGATRTAEPRATPGPRGLRRPPPPPVCPTVLARSQSPLLDSGISHVSLRSAQVIFHGCRRVRLGSGITVGAGSG